MLALRLFVVLHSIFFFRPTVVLSRQIYSYTHLHIARSRNWNSRQDFQPLKWIKSISTTSSASVPMLTLSAQVQRRELTASAVVCVIPTILVTGSSTTLTGARTVTASGSTATGLPSIVSDADDLGEVYFFQGASSAQFKSSTTCSASPPGDFGLCTVPAIEFGLGFDGRTGASFRPVDRVSYNRSSSTEIDDIAAFICGAIISMCGGDATAEATCQTARAACNRNSTSYSFSSLSTFSGIPDQSSQDTDTGSQADAFNGVMGFQTNFTNVTPENGLPSTLQTFSATTTASSDILTSSVLTASVNPTSGDTDASITVSSASSTHIGVTSTTTSPAGQTPTEQSSPTISPSDFSGTSPSTSAAAAVTATSDNLQTFQGALGGILPSAVTASGNSFIVEGNSFNKLQKALARSCDIQKNACSDAANASNFQNGRHFTVQQCSDQRTSCVESAGG